MYLSSERLRGMVPKYQTSHSNIYDLYNGNLLKIFTNVSGNYRSMALKKIGLASKYREITEIAIPVDICVTEFGVNGYVYPAKKGIDFSQYCRELHEQGGSISLSEITEYIAKLEAIMKKGHEMGVCFPDLLSKNNVLYDRNPEDSSIHVSLIDYDGLQLKEIPSGAISQALLNWIPQLKGYNKYLPEVNQITEELDKFQLALRYLSYCTNVNLFHKLSNPLMIDMLLEYSGIDNTSFAKCIELLKKADVKNEYITESILELDHDYRLSPYEEGEPRVFIKK